MLYINSKILNQDNDEAKIQVRQKKVGKDFEVTSVCV